MAAPTTPSPPPSPAAHRSTPAPSSRGPLPTPKAPGPATACAGEQGSLSPSDEFTHDGEGFFWVFIRYTGDRLLVLLRRTERYVDSTDYALAGRVLALQLGPRTFVFGYDDRTQDGAINFYDHGLAWAVGDTVDVRLAALNPPAAPAGLTANADGNTRIDLQWQAPADDGGSALTGYRIEVSEDGGSRWSSLVANLAADPASDTVTYSHTGLAAAITRHYRVSAINAVGISDPSGTAFATTDGTYHATAGPIPGTVIFPATLTPGTRSDADGTWTGYNHSARSGSLQPPTFAHAGHGFSLPAVEFTGTQLRVTLSRTHGSGADPLAGSRLTLHLGPEAFPFGYDERGGDGSIAFTPHNLTWADGDRVDVRLALLTPPDAPAGLEAEARGAYIIDLAWEAPASDGGSPVTSYRIEVSDNSGGTWSDLVADTKSTDTAFSHTGLAAGSLRHYRVSAFNDHGISDPSNTAFATTARVAATAPAAPTGLTATASGSARIDLAWAAPASDGGSAITGYRIEVSADGGLSWSDLVADTRSGAITYSHTRLAPETTRHYRVSAINSAGTSSPSNTAFASTAAAAAQVEIWSATLTVKDLGSGLLGCRQGTSGAECDNSSVLSDDGFQVGSTDFAVLVMQLLADGRLDLILSPDITSRARSLTLYVDGTAFAFGDANITTLDSRHWLNSGLGWSAGDTVALRLTLPASAPDPPTGLAAIPVGGSQIDLSWTAPASDGGFPVTGYRIEVSEDAGASWTDLVGDTESPLTEHPHAGLAKGDTRHYRVSAINVRGVSGPSNTAFATTSEAIEVEVWSATLTVPELAEGPLGCSNSAGNAKRCSNTAVLSDDDFLVGSTAFGILSIRLQADRTLNFIVDTDLISAARSLTLHVGDAAFAFRQADGKLLASRHWYNSGLDWSAGDTVSLRLTFAAPAVPGTLLYAGTLVAGTGTRGGSDYTGYSDASGYGYLYPEGFAYKRQAFSFGAIEYTGNRLAAQLLRTEGSGDATLADGILVLHLGTKAFNFRYDDLDSSGAIDFSGHGLAWDDGEGVDVRLALLSPPGPPTGLTATPRGRDTVDLVWTAPANDGGTPVTGYRIEFTAGGTWSDLAADTGSTETAFSHSGLAAGKEYGYRVSAINAAGTSEASNVDNATTGVGAHHHAAPASIPGTQLFSGTLQAGTLTETEGTWVGYGLFVGAHGSLLPSSEFSHDGEGFLIFVIRHTQDRLLFQLRRTERLVDSTDLALAGRVLALHLGPRTFVFGYDDRDATGSIDFYNHGLAWALGDIVDVRLALLSPPGAPASLAAAARGRDTIDLSWQRPASDGGAPLTGYRIEVSEDEGLTWSDLVAAAPPTAISYSHTGLVGGSERHYRVSAINAAGTSDPSDSASDTTDFIHHAAPAGIPGTVVYSATLTAGTADQFGTTYTGYNSGNGSGSLSPAEFDHGGHSRTFAFMAFAGSNLVASLGAVSSDDPLAGSLVVLHLGPRAFPFAFDDILDDGRVDFSPHGLTWLAGDTADVRLALLSSPDPPTGLTATARGRETIRLDWAAPASDGGTAITGYRIEESPDGSSGSWSDLVGNTASPATTYTHEGLSEGDTRHYRVSAINAAGTSDPSGTASDTTEEATVPGAPTGLTATARGTDAIRVEWSAPASDGGSPLTGYRIEVSPDGSSNSWSDLVADTNSTAVTYDHTGLSSSSTRHYRVSAINAVGTSDPSDTASDTTGANHHAAPASIPGTVLYSATLIAGTADHSGTSYTGYNSSNGSGSLSPGGFSYGGHSRAFAFMAFAGSNLAVELTAASPADPLAGSSVVLYLGPKAFPFDFDYILDDGSIEFTPHGLTWLAGDTVDVRFALLSRPGAPRELSATARGTDAIRLDWSAPASDGGADITGYRIEVSSNGGVGWSNLSVNTASPATTYTHEGLSEGDTRHYRVSAINAVGRSGFSNIAFATTKTATVPGPPTALSATASGTGTIRLDWVAPASDGGADISGYKIEWSADGNAPWRSVPEDTGSAATTYPDTGLDSGTTRHYRVSAINAAGTSAPSNTAYATAYAKPGAPRALTATARGANVIRLDWVAPASNGGTAITGYRIEVSEDAGSNWADLVANTTATTHLHSGLSEGDTRHYRVSAINAVGTSGHSNTASDTTEALSAPDAPTALTAAARGRETIRLDWAAPASDGGTAITGYRIEVSEDAGSNWADLVANTISAATAYLHRGLSEGDTRHYRVSAINRTGTSNPSDIAFATTEAASVPEPPRDLSATGRGRNTIDLNWVAPAGDGGADITGYRIEVSVDGGKSWVSHVRHTLSLATAYSHVGLSSGDTRHYRVSAINRAGDSDPSNIAFASTQALPGPPTALTAAANGSAQIDLNWVAPASDGGAAISGYRIEVSPDGGLAWSVLRADTGSDATAHSHTGLAPETTRHYRVYAINLAGTSDASNIDFATTEAAQGTPTNLTATALGTDTIELVWRPPSGPAVTGYRIEFSADGSPGSWSDLEADTGSTSIIYTHGGLSSGDTRHYRVSAIRDGVTSAPSNTASATTHTAPGAPTGLTAAARGKGTIDLRWSAPANDGGTAVSGYRIEVSPDGTSGSWSDLAANTGSTATAYSHTGLADETTRHYRVSAINSAGTSAASGTASDTTHAAPDAPTGLAATARGKGTIDLRWSAPANDGGTAITGYRIEWSADGTSGSWSDLAADTGSAATTYSDSGLAAGTTRHYRVSAISAVGTSAPSGTDSATTDAVPGAPTGLTATANGRDSIDLNWSAPASDGGAAITGYRIEWSADGTSDSWADLVANTNSAAVAYSDTGLAASTTRHYRVSAINAVGTSAPSGTDSATTDAATAPDAPTGLTATARGKGTIVLSWSAPASDGGAAITGYRIEWSADGAAPWSDLVANTGSGATGYPDTGLADETTRHYRVSAINAAGTSAPSNTASGTTGTAPGAPTGLTATASGRTRIDLSWSAPASDGGTAITGYRIEWSADGTSGSWSDLVASTGSTAIAYSDTGLAPGATRHYRVSTINAAGISAPSNTASDTTDTALGAPTGLTATASGGTRIDLSWSAPASDGGAAISGYRIEFSADGVSDWTDLVANTGSDAVAYSDDGLAPGTTRHYRVSAINADGTSAPSNIASAITDEPPGAPTDLTATARGKDTIQLDWAAPASDGGAAISGYRIEFSATGESDWTEFVATTGSDATAYPHTGLSEGDTLYYRVSAINAAGTSAPSNTASATTGEPVAPDPPTDLTATARGKNTIRLDWAAPASDGRAAITGYRIESSATGDSDWTELVASTGSDATTYRHIRLQEGATVYYRVSAINSIGTSRPSNIASATTGEAGTADPPTGLTANARAKDTIDLSWNAPASDGGAEVSGYRIEVSEDEGLNWSVLEANTRSAATAYSHTGLVLRRHAPLPRLRHQRRRHLRPLQHRLRHHPRGPRRPHRPDCQRRREHADRPELERAGQRRRVGHQRLPHRGFRRRRLELERAPG